MNSIAHGDSIFMFFVMERHVFRLLPKEGEDKESKQHD
ncbi:hypothetical protein ADIS_0031 [Lunatimonas lonarensis]|uniref:Uncharacterized protein n=1 Tax=Lunatimonas lonarensis TaxID=1232681 RepID=R7ZZI0_9BACT|nr:hypothetical protein ADIS_0031 [Lunatimonas lonarensis]